MALFFFYDEDLVNGHPTNSPGKCFDRFPKCFWWLLLLELGECGQETVDGKQETQDSLLDRPVSNPQCRFYNLQSVPRTATDATATAQLCCCHTVLYTRSSRVKEVWLARWWNVHRIKARKTSLDNHWQTIYIECQVGNHSILKRRML